MIKTCQYASCLEDVAEDAVFVSLKTPTNSYNEKRAGFCCAYHAALSLLRLAVDRKDASQEQISEAVKMLPTRWRTT